MKHIQRMTKIIMYGTYSLLAGVMLLFFPLLLGKQPMIVLSGSMRPALTEGSLVYMETAGYDEVETGDIVSYGREQVISHRVVEKREETRSLITKGDANTFLDPEVPEKAVIGKIWNNVRIPYAGFLLQIFRKSENIVKLLILMIFSGGIGIFVEK